MGIGKIGIKLLIQFPKIFLTFFVLLHLNRKHLKAGIELAFFRIIESKFVFSRATEKVQ